MSAGNPLEYLTASIRRCKIACCLLAIAAGSCSKEDKATASSQRTGPTPVQVAEVMRKDMPFLLRAIGRVTPTQTVVIKPLVTGQIGTVHLQDGRDVKTGDLLFSIDRRPFEVALGESQAALAQATTQAANAKTQERRYLSLAKRGAVPQKEQEQATATAQTATDQVLIASAAVQKAELNLSYCEIRAPISGRAGRVLADVGNVVSAYQTEMVVINQIDPIEVTFAIPEQQLPALQRGMATGSLHVAATSGQSERMTVEGQVTFVDNTVKPNTGTIDVSATFKNNPPVLWPGQYANLSIEVSVDRDAVVAPARAVQPGQNGPFVFVVEPDMTVRATQVVVARTVEDHAIISNGLRGGEKVVIDGHDRLRDGAKVHIKPSLDEAAPKVTAVTAP